MNIFVIINYKDLYGYLQGTGVPKRAWGHLIFASKFKFL